jgi:hypothetical protein
MLCYPQEGTYTLIHIPLGLYSSLLQPLLRVLLPFAQNLDQGEDPEQDQTFETTHGFLNISVTPIEVSVVCRSEWATAVFEPAIQSLPKDAVKTVDVSKNSYMVISVISAGLDAASRVIELTSPLALATIPIFFISTYYSDFILVPTKEKQNVVKALLTKGFELSENQSDFVNPSAYGHARASSHPSTSPPTTPPPSNMAELQTRAIELLKKRSVTPLVHQALELVQCSGREVSTSSTGYDHHHHHQRQSSSRQTNGYQRTWADEIDTKLYTCIISALVSQPRFLSVTLAQGDPPSLLLDKTLLPIFGNSLVGDTESSHFPIFLDLVSLPAEVTGIVCGVAGKLVQAMEMAESSELSYLSTARAGAVILPEGYSVRALDILQTLLQTET